MLKSAVIFLVLTSVYCKPLLELTEEEQELMKNPLFPILFREFLYQVTSLQTQNTNGHESHLNQIIHQANIDTTTFSTEAIEDESNVNLPLETSSSLTSRVSTSQNALVPKTQQEYLAKVQDFSSITGREQSSVESSHNTVNKIVVTTAEQNNQEAAFKDDINTTKNASSQENSSNDLDESTTNDEFTSFQGTSDEEALVKNFEAQKILDSESSDTHDIEDTLQVSTKDLDQSSKNKYDEESDQSETNTVEMNSTENDTEEKDTTEMVQAPIDETRYQFATRVDDNFNGNFQQREETREGSKLTGSYAYDDGNILRTVTYEADDKGFRIVKDVISPSIKAMQERSNLAEVQTFNNGHKVRYNVIQEEDEED